MNFPTAARVLGNIADHRWDKGCKYIRKYVRDRLFLALYSVCLNGHCCCGRAGGATAAVVAS